jgi:hypothetical protein
LSRLAEEFGCCILLVRHLSKAPTGKAIHRGLGSIDLTGAVGCTSCARIERRRSRSNGRGQELPFECARPGRTAGKGC